MRIILSAGADAASTNSVLNLKMEGDDMEMFNLRWHNHQSSVTGALSRMFASGVLADVTLSAGGVLIKAHRLVLACCSQYFAQLFKEVEAESNTLVVVLACDAAELRLLLSFMYTGEVTASRRALPALLRLANTLRVAGLTDADCSNPTPTIPERTTIDNEPETASPINLEQNRTEPTDNTPPIDNNSNIFKFNFEDLTGTSDNEQRNDLTEALRYGERLSKLDQIVQNLYTHRNEGPTITTATATSISNSSSKQGGATCPVCGKRLSSAYNLRVHLDTHARARHACRACAHVSRSRDALRKHVAYRHPRV